MLKLDELDRISIPEFKNSEKNPVAIVLDNIRSLNNVGSIFRTSDAFRIEKIYLCGITGTPPHRDIHRTALGSEDTVEWQYYENTADAIHYLRSINYEILAVEQTDSAIQLNEFKPNAEKKYAFVLGNEVDGVDENIINMAGKSLEIPQFGSKHSLNVSIAAGIVLWDYILKTRF
jgi:23S rRNA (guanosine2251-2'-O)-methyltransferase